MNTQPDNQEVECQQASDALVAHFDGAANEAEKQLATAHLAHCSACAQMWREWQSLRLMEQRALEPVASGEMLPLAPVKVPVNLKAAILRKTVAPPIWQRFWPRLLTGMAVPTFAVACWLLIVAAPWQQSVPVISTQSNTVPTPAKRVATVPNVSNPSSATHKGTAEMSPIKTTAPRPVSVTPNSTTIHAPHVTSTTTNKYSAKSTFKTDSTSKNSRSQTILVKTPQISMASFDSPRSRAAKAAASKTAKQMITVAPKPRATSPILVADLPAQDTPNSTDASSDPVLNYVAQNDVRPDDIRQAVENYRAALLDDGSDL